MPHLELAGSHVMLGDGYGVDKMGNVWLDAKDGALQWAGCINPLPPCRPAAAPPAPFPSRLDDRRMQKGAFLCSGTAPSTFCKYDDEEYESYYLVEATRLLHQQATASLSLQLLLLHQGWESDCGEQELWKLPHNHVVVEEIVLLMRPCCKLLCKPPGRGCHRASSEVLLPGAAAVASNSKCGALP